MQQLLYSVRYSSAHAGAVLIFRRVPDSSSNLPLCVVLVLVHWSWCLYVLSYSSSGAPLIQAVYIFAGSILLADNIFVKIFGSIIGLIGVAYVVLEFIPSIEPPQNMREADGGWGAEQV